MDKIDLDNLRKLLAEHNGTELYTIAVAALAIAQELRRMNDRTEIEDERQESLRRYGPDPEYSGSYPTADEILGRWRS